VPHLSGADGAVYVSRDRAESLRLLPQLKIQDHQRKAMENFGMGAAGYLQVENNPSRVHCVVEECRTLPRNCSRWRSETPTMDTRGRNTQSAVGTKYEDGMGTPYPVELRTCRRHGAGLEKLLNKDILGQCLVTVYDYRKI
jgi:hypothetical protein